MSIYLAKVKTDSPNIEEQFVFIEYNAADGSPLKWMSDSMNEAQARRQLSDGGMPENEVEACLNRARANPV